MVYMRKKEGQVIRKKRGRGMLQIGEPVVKRVRDQAVMVHKPLSHIFLFRTRKILNQV